MKHYYKPRTYEIGQRLLALRNQTGLTQTELGQLIGVSRRSILNWEGGEGVPNGTHLRRLFEVFADRQAFTASQEIAEAAALWEGVSQAAHKRLGLFNTHWFEQLLSGDQGRRSEDMPTVQLEQAALSDHHDPHARNLPGSRLPVSPVIDWGEAIVVPALYGRESEIETLQQWVVEEHCRVVAVVGLGGIGKSSLATTFARQFAASFDSVLFRTLQNGPPLAEVLDHTIRAISDQRAAPPDLLSDKIALLIQLFRERRCLLILDNFESIMQPGALSGTYRSGYAEYGDLLHALGEREHHSCVVLTGREKPAELGPLQGRTAPVRALHLSDLDDRACYLLLEARDIVATPADASALARLYGGNPLALQLVAEPIRELFGGDVGAFLAMGDAFVGGVGQLLAQQFARSTPLEQTIVYWLAVERELVPLAGLLADLAEAVPQREVLAALESLRRRMLIEHGQDRPTFSLQPVILEYVTDQLIEAVRQEIVDGQPKLLQRHALVQATAREHVRLSQERLIATPLLERLASSSQGADTVEHQLLTLLASWRGRPPREQGFGPGNVINLLRLLRDNLRALDLSRLAIRQAYLQGVDVQDSHLTAATIQDSRFTENFDAINGIAISSAERYWAAASRRGEIRVWQAGGQVLYHVWQAHTERVWALAFSPDERALVSGSWDSTIKLWDVASATLRWSGKHTGNINSVAFASDGTLLASGGARDVIIWDVQRGTQLQTLPHPALVITVDWSPHGHLMATGDVAGRIRFWQINDTEPAVSLRTVDGHTQLISELAFAPDGTMLASASYDSTVKVWDVASGQLQETLSGHTQRVHRVAWSRDSRLLASAGYERQIWLWDRERRSYRAVLQGHTDSLSAIAFTPDSTRLLSSGDTTVRVWDIASGRCIHVLQGNAAALFDVDWSPDGRHVVSADANAFVSVFTVTGEAPPLVLHGHQGLVFGVAWSPDGERLASSSWDTTIRLWDPSAGAAVQVLRNPDDPITFFCGVAWSPDGERLASATYLNVQGVLVWDVRSGARYWTRHTDATPIRRVAWSPDGERLAGGGDNGSVYLWNAADGRLLRQLVGHRGTVKEVAWSGDGSRLVSAGGSVEGGELFVWDVQAGEAVQRFVGQAAIVCAVAWGPSDNLVVSGGGDGMLRWWDLARGTSVLVREAHQGAVQSLRRNPDRTKVASCGDDGAIRVWDLQSGEYLQTLRRDRPYERMEISGLMGITAAQHASLIALGAREELGDKHPATE